MFLIVVEHPRHRQRRTFDKDTITIGRSKLNDVELPDPNVSRRHARVTRVGGQFFVEDLGSGNGTRVDDSEPVVGLTRVPAGGRVQICDFTLVLENVQLGDEITVEAPRADLEPTEAELVEALQEHDDEARLVYADWLEGQGQLAQAEYLRLEEQLHHAPVDEPQRAGWAARLREVAAATPLSWRRQFARRCVEPCSTAHWPDCPREWLRLRPTGGESVRFCGTCDRDVFYCLSIPEALSHTGNDQRVVIDAAVERSPYDLYPVRPTANPPAPRR